VGFQLTETETVTVTVIETEKIRTSQPTESKLHDAIIRTRSSMRREELSWKKVWICDLEYWTRKRAAAAERTGERDKS